MPERVSPLAIVVALTLVGFGLRLHQINAVPIRGDEFFTLTYWMEQPLSETLYSASIRDPHPPLAYALYRGWALLVGSDAFVARLLSVLLSVIGIPAIYALGKRLLDERIGLLAALLWVVHPFHIWHAQDARNYAIWGALSPLALWLGLSAIDRRRRLDWLLYLLAALAAAYVYYLELFTIVILNLYVLLTHWRDRSLLLRWISIQVVIGVSLLPWFVYLRGRLLSGDDSYGGTTGGFALTQLWTRFLPELHFGATLPPNLVAWLPPAIALALLTGVWVLWQRFGWRLVLLVLLGVIPPILLAGVSLVLNVFTPRYVLMTTSAYTLIVAGLIVVVADGFQSKSQPHLRRHWGGLVAGFVLSGWLLLSGYSLYNHYYVDAYAKAPNWRGLLAYLSEHATPDDIIIQAAADEALNYYYDRLTLPFDRKQLPANPTQPTDEIHALLEADRQTHESLWLVAQTFPDWGSAGVVETWTDEHMQLVRKTDVDGIRVEQYRNWSVSADETESQSLATFGDVVELVGVEVLSLDATPGQLTVWLYWQPLRQTDTALTMFVHLAGDINPANGTPLWSQADQQPQQGRVSTTNWSPQTIYRDVYVLPLNDVPTGSYVLLAGVYDPSTGERLPVDGGDSYRLQTLEIAPN